MAGNSLKVDVIPYATAGKEAQLEGKTVVVIDVLRATTVMITALVNGAEAVIPVVSEQKAKQTANGLQDGQFVLGGEKETKKINGFHLGNSPLEYLPDTVAGKKVVMTTTNGTKALEHVKNAGKVWIAGFLNLSAVVDKLKSEHTETVLYCSGTNNSFSLDDGLCAAFILGRLVEKRSLEMSDFALLLRKAFPDVYVSPEALLSGCYHLNLLKSRGFEKDVDYCLQTDLFDAVPYMNRDGAVVL